MFSNTVELGALLRSDVNDAFAFDQRDVRMTFLKIDACWNKLRSRHRFKMLMDRMGFTTGSGALGVM